MFDQATDEFTGPRRLLVYELTGEEYAREAERHKRWEEVGGTSHCFHLAPEQRHRLPIARDALQRIYEEERVRPRPDYTSHESSSWFVPSSLNRS